MIANISPSSRTVGLASAALTAAGLAVIHAGPGVTAIGAVRQRLWPSLAGRGVADHVALTFDDGPDLETTPLFLEALRVHGLRATFFLVGSYVRRAPELAAEVAAAGHEIGVHGWEHRYLPLRGPGATYRDLARASEVIAEATGTVPWLFRPPYGVLSSSAILAARQLRLTCVLWTNWGREWAPGSTADSVFATLATGLTGGATVLLHDSDHTSPAGSANAALGALPLLLDECARRNLRVGPLSEHGERWQRPGKTVAAARGGSAR